MSQLTFRLPGVPINVNLCADNVPKRVERSRKIRVRQVVRQVVDEQVRPVRTLLGTVRRGPGLSPAGRGRGMGWGDGARTRL